MESKEDGILISCDSNIHKVEVISDVFIENIISYIKIKDSGIEANLKCNKFNRIDSLENLYSEIYSYDYIYESNYRNLYDCNTCTRTTNNKDKICNYCKQYDEYEKSFSPSDNKIMHHIDFGPHTNFELKIKFDIRLCHLCHLLYNQIHVCIMNSVSSIVLP